MQIVKNTIRMILNEITIKTRLIGIEYINLRKKGDIHDISLKFNIFNQRRQLIYHPDLTTKCIFLKLFIYDLNCGCPPYKKMHTLLLI